MGWSVVCGCVSLAQNGVRRCLASGLRRSHDRGWVISRCNRAKTAQQYLLCGIRTVKRQNRPCRYHAFVKIRRDRRTPVVRLSGEPPRDPNQSSAPPVMDYNRLTPGEAKRNASCDCGSSWSYSPTFRNEFTWVEMGKVAGLLWRVYCVNP